MPATKAPWRYLVLLVAAGESVFILPFVLPRVFRPTVLQTFAIDNTELGLAMSVYGTVALLSYLAGGPLADRFAPRKLMATALWLTAMGGVYLATFPAYAELRFLYGYWGFTTIFLFWAPMIKATRIWGEAAGQGKAFGFLDGGRGLVGALFGVLGVAVYAAYLKPDVAGAVVGSQAAFRYVILACSGIVAMVGALVWRFMTAADTETRSTTRDRITLSEITQVLRLPAVWLLMVIILSAYVSYKVTDVFSLYASEVMGYGGVASARVGTAMLFLRPIVGVTAGLLADRTRPTRWLFLSFVLSAVAALPFAFGVITGGATTLFVLSTVAVATGVYAARALYFSVMAAGHIPLTLTGTAVGLISLIGYTPDIFAGPLMGYFLDGSPGIAGHQLVFWMVVTFSVLGGVASGVYHWRFGADDVAGRG